MTNKTTSAIDPVERVARAIDEANGALPGYKSRREIRRLQARAAIEAQSDTITRLQAALKDAKTLLCCSRSDTNFASQRFYDDSERTDLIAKIDEALRSSVGGE